MNTERQNEQLVAYLREHNIEVLCHTAEAITVNTLFNINGKSAYVYEAIPATAQAVRDYLGY